MKLLPVKNAPEWLKQDPKSGKYWVDIYRANGKPKRLTRSTKIRDSKERARVKGDQMISRWLGEALDGTKERKLFSEIGDQVIQHEAVNRSGTHYNAKLHVGQLCQAFGHLYVDQITPGLWKNFEAEFRLNHPGKIFFNLHKHMSLVMNHAYRLGLIPRPWVQKTPKDKTKPARVLTPEEKTAILENAGDTLRDQLVLAMTMGMRLREHIKLSWSQIDLEARTLRLDPEHTKTKKGRTISLSPQAFEVLCGRKRAARSAWVFPYGKDLSKPVNSNKSAWRLAKQKAGIVGRCRYHDLRHTFLTECAKMVREGSMSVALICAYAGLSIRVFEKTYLHLSHEDTRGVAEMIAVKLR